MDWCTCSCCQCELLPGMAPAADRIAIPAAGRYRQSRRSGGRCPLRVSGPVDRRRRPPARARTRTADCSSGPRERPLRTTGRRECRDRWRQRTALSGRTHRNRNVAPANTGPAIPERSTHHPLGGVAVAGGLRTRGNQPQRSPGSRKTRCPPQIRTGTDLHQMVHLKICFVSQRRDNTW